MAPRFIRIDELGEHDVTASILDMMSAFEALLGGGTAARVESSPASLVAAAPRSSMKPTEAPVLSAGPHLLSCRLPDGSELSLLRRGPARRVLEALIVHHEFSPGESLSVEQVFRAGWPNQQARLDAAAARVYTTIRLLRNLGLRPWLLGRDDGYLLATELVVERS